MPQGAEGYVVGVFDLFHIGHLDAVRLAAGRCARLVVGVADDDVACQVRGVRPFVPETERRQIISSLRCVAEVVPVSDLDLRSQVRRHGVDVVFAPEDDDVAQRLIEGLHSAEPHHGSPGSGHGSFDLGDGPLGLGDGPGALGPGVTVVRLSGARATSSTAVRAALGSDSSRTSVA